MKCLSKIVFINSANTPYADVKLDGNVHFIGTQGVGKSTLLRAILFFYNGDKMKLGIPKEKKGFDDFYLPHSNSYIVYEVTHDLGTYCVLAFRSQGRACFRFIGAPYDRNWLVDVTGDVTSEYTVIRQRLDGIYMSRIIDKYDEYRNILYGNRHAIDKEFIKFSLIESSRFENIPRSLQNVFLNSRVDADFIKEIIIRSMNEDEVGIDLGYYRRQVAEFEQEYNDISMWFRTNAKGETVIRQQADKAIRSYQQLLYCKERITTSYSELLYAVRIASERIPLLDEQIAKIASDIQKSERLLSEEKQKFDKETADINKQIGEVEGKLREIKSKRRKYEEMGIDEIVRRVDLEGTVRAQLDTLTSTKTLLTSQYHDLSAKYDALEKELTDAVRTFETDARARMLQCHETWLRTMEEHNAALTRKRSDIDAEFSAAKKIIDEKLEAQRAKEQSLDKEFIKLSYSKPLENEINAEKEKLRGLDNENVSLKSEARARDLEIKDLCKDLDMNTGSLEREAQARISGLEREAATFKAKIEDIDKLLSLTGGSLYEWLDANVSGWEKTIGKVVDEKRVLYRKGLKPRIMEDGQSLFGVQLDLSEVESDIRTPKELKSERETYVEAIKDIEVSIADVRKSCEEEKEKVSNGISPKIKALREAKSITEARLNALPGLMKECEVKIQGLTDRQEEILKDRRDELEHRRIENIASREQLENELRICHDHKEKKLKAAEKGHAEKAKEAEAVKDGQTGMIKREIQEKKVALAKDIGELKGRRDAELKGAGVDTEALNRCELQITEVRKELGYIENHRSTCIEYRKDCRELFNREDEFKDLKNVLDSRRGQLSDKYRLRKERLDEQIATGRRDLDGVKTDKKECEDGIRKCVDFQMNESMFPAYLHNMEEKATMMPASLLVDDLMSAIHERSELKDKFKVAVNMFKGNFGPNNIFKFKTNLTTDEEYLEFASGLTEFIELEKIEDYRGRTSDRYLEILNRVSREMGDITHHGSEVEKIIREINYDFKDKNFVGAIKSIEIRRTDSGDRMVQLLLKIKDFTDENQFQFSGINLFSETGDRSGINRQAVRFLQDFMGSLNEFSGRSTLTLSDTFQLQFRVVENDNDTGWVEKIANVGSDGTDILVKAMVNIMLINVFKEKASRKSGEFRIHCMMDEVGKLHPSNVKGILDFANSRNILLINSSPTTYNVADYRYTYLLQKDSASKTIVTPLITRKEAEIGK